MEVGAANRTALPSKSDNLRGLRDNQGRNEPRLPGTAVPAPGWVPLVYIYQPAPSPTQSGRARSKEWVLEFEPTDPPEIDPLTGWIGSDDPFAHIQLRFPDRQRAIDFAERQGWRYEVRDPAVPRFQQKSYADNFRYQVAGAIARSQHRWDGSVSITDRREPDGTGPPGWPYANRARSDAATHGRTETVP
jgi:hypothetical protein